MTTNNDDRLNLKSAGNYSISGHSLTICSSFRTFLSRVFLSLSEKTVQSTSGKMSPVVITLEQR